MVDLEELTTEFESEALPVLFIVASILEVTLGVRVWAKLLCFFAALSREAPNGSGSAIGGRQRAVGYLWAPRGAWHDVGAPDMPPTEVPTNALYILVKNRPQGAFLAKKLESPYITITRASMAKTNTPARIYGEFWV